MRHRFAVADDGPYRKQERNVLIQSDQYVPFNIGLM